MTLKQVRDWLKPQVTGLAAAYIAKTDPLKENAICIYNRASSNSRIAIGGLPNTSTGMKSISILVQWSKNADTTEQNAKSIYDIFYGQSATIDGIDAFFTMKNDEPVFVGANENDIFECVIDLDITYKRG